MAWDMLKAVGTTGQVASRGRLGRESKAMMVYLRKGKGPLLVMATAVSLSPSDQRKSDAFQGYPGLQPSPSMLAGRFAACF